MNVEWATCGGLIYTVDLCVGEGVCFTGALYYSGGRVIVKHWGRDSEMLSMTEGQLVCVGAAWFNTEQCETGPTLLISDIYQDELQPSERCSWPWWWCSLWWRMITCGKPRGKVNEIRHNCPPVFHQYVNECHVENKQRIMNIFLFFQTSNLHNLWQRDDHANRISSLFVDSLCGNKLSPLKSEIRRRLHSHISNLSVYHEATG